VIVVEVARLNTNEGEKPVAVAALPSTFTENPTGPEVAAVAPFCVADARG